MSFFRFLVLICLFLNSLFSQQIEFKGQVLSLSGHHQNSSEADVVRIQLKAFDVLQKEAQPNAAVAWLKNNRELGIAKKDFPTAALKELEVFSTSPFYPLHLPFSQIPANKSEGFICSGTFSLIQTEEQWQIKDLQLKDFAFTETIPVATDNSELFSVVIPEIARFSPLVIPSEIKDLPAEQLSADESLKALNENGNGYACGTLNNGAYYCGWFQNWRPHGKGQIRYTDGDEYTGDFLYGYRWGYGIYKYKASGDRYEGNFVQSRLEGKGTYYWAIGDRYEGAFENGKIHGQGKYVWANGQEYEGGWVHNQMHGYGIHTWPKSYAARRFTGWFYQNKPKGEGEFETDGLVDNSTIIYKTKNWAVAANNGFGGAYTGSIEFRFTDGNRDSYEGEWKDLALNSCGKAIFHNGDIYDGEWQNNKFHGRGMYEWTAQNLPNPANSSAVYSGEWHEGIPVYNGLATFLKELEVSNDPNDYFEDVPPALQEEFKQLISAWEAEYRSHTFHHERADLVLTGVHFGSGHVYGLLSTLAQIAYYTKGSSLVIAATAAAPYVALIGAGVAAGYILNEVYNRQTKEREKAVATTKSKVDEEKKLGLIYGRWDRNNKLTSIDKSGQLIIRGEEGKSYDVPEKYTEQYPESDFGTGKPVYQYIGRTTQARYQCRQNEHGWALGRVFRKNGWGTPQIYHFDPKEQNIPGNELNWKIAEQHWVKVVGGPALDFDSKKNLQNKINPIGMGGFEETFGPFPSDPEDLEDFINAVLECALD